jgi:hypothetical protein
MKTKTCTILIVLALGLIPAVAVSSDVFPPRWAEWKPTLKPVSLPGRAGPVQIEFIVNAFKQPKDTTETLRAEFEIEVLGDIIVNHPIQWTAQVPWDQPYREIIDVVVLPDDTGGLRIRMAAPGRANSISIWLWETDEGVISHGTDPSFHPPTRERKSEYEMFMDTASAETANEMIKGYFSLAVLPQNYLEEAVDLLGDQLKPYEGQGYEGPDDSMYVAMMPRWVRYKLLDLQVYVADSPPPPIVPMPGFDRNNPGGERDKRPGDSSSESQGHSELRTDSDVYLVGVEGESSPGYLDYGETIRFHIGIDNSTGGYIGGMTNGFRIYSPDGAEWDTTTAVIHSSLSSYFA